MSTKLGYKTTLENNQEIKALKIGIVKAKWNSEITNAVEQGAVETLKKYQVQEITLLEVPGSIELTFGAKKMILNSNLDAVIVLGCIIQGETRHFDFVAKSITDGITQLNLNYNVPVIFGVLTTNTQQQALDRAGGKYGNKGAEAAETAIEMALINRRFMKRVKRL